MIASTGESEVKHLLSVFVLLAHFLAHAEPWASKPDGDRPRENCDSKPLDARNGD